MYNILMRRKFFSILIILLIVSLCAAFATDSGVVRVGYYENEVFEEGAEEGAVKTGYAYEYYRKLSEYTGWRYEYVQALPKVPRYCRELLMAHSCHLKYNVALPV